jgi:hypothetical protein
VVTALRVDIPSDGPAPARLPFPARRKEVWSAFDARALAAAVPVANLSWPMVPFPRRRSDLAHLVGGPRRAHLCARELETKRNR